VPRYLVTSALPYANGPLHFGHMIGAYLPADVYVRTLRMQGEEVRFICGTDEHGVAITIGAEREGTPYAEYVARWRAAIGASMAKLGIEFDIFSGTSVSPEHVASSQEIFRRLDENGYLLQQENEQLYCVTDRMFLADRYIEGTCPNCGFERARGDECPRCGNWIDPLTMPAVRCKLCGTVPEKRRTRHWYLDLPALRDEHLGRWVAEHEWKPNVAAFIANMLKETHPRAITRDMSWGVPLPEDLSGGQTGKVLYVWFDAPIGYISFTKEWAARAGRPEAWREWWQPEDPADVRLVHFLGKDNIPFHCFVFPAMLWGAKSGWVLPWAVPAHEFYNLEGAKFSTSAGWSIALEPFFERYDADATRFYLLSSAPETSDSEWSWQGFQNANNSLLADAIGNLATRVLRFIDKHFEGRVPPLEAAHVEELDALLLERSGPIGDPALCVREFRFRRAAELLIENARAANVFVDRSAPWGLRKSDPARCASVLNTCCDYLAWMARWMAPAMPGKAQALWAMLGRTGAVAEAGWPGVPAAGSWRSRPDGTRLGTVTGLFAKIEDAAIEAELAALRAGARPS
jgi:methionyl-tRNA synthetase